MWNAANILIGCLAPLLIGAAIRYAARKSDRPMTVSVCLVAAVIAAELVITVKNSTFSAYLQKLDLRAAIFAVMMLGAAAADLIYRIRSKQRK